jgi:hypothetical protein
LWALESVNGNGRTCDSCHTENNNFTIDPKFIDTLPDDDPLFSAEFVPALLENFEKPELMRKVGLILENTNGFDDLDNNFTIEDAIPLLKEANNKIEREIKTRRNNRSRRLMQDAIVKLDQVREAMIIRSN